ncbi:MAG: sugar ABC transporter permease [Syntrophorhabdaceae bacterium]|nr:sugar ABC transporter permease [Syntrophorhabdaceae bacterium]
MKAMEKLLKINFRQFGMIFTLLALIVFFQIQTDGLVLTSANMINLLNGNSYILVLAIGMVLVIIAGHIDLSVGSVAAFTGIVTALSIKDFGVSPGLSMIICLALGALIGAWHGFWIAYVGIPAFIVTLAGMMLFRGANQFVGKSDTIPVPEQIQFIGSGYLPSIGPDTGYNNLTLLLGAIFLLWLVIHTIKKRQAIEEIGGELPPIWMIGVRLFFLGGVVIALTYLYASGRPGTSFPIPGLILFIIMIIYTFITEKTVMGRHIYSVGGNRKAAGLSGVNTRLVDFLVMMNMSILASLAGLMFIGRATASGPFDGVGWELDAVSAVFIGGAAVSGGVGTVIGSVVGGMVMAVLNNGLQLMGIGADMTQMIKGMVLILAVAFDVYSKSQGRPSVIGLIFKRHEISHATDNAGKVKAYSPIQKLIVVILSIAVITVVSITLIAFYKSFFKASHSMSREGEKTGFPKDSLIGVALPQKTSENWVLAERLFKEGLSKEGYKTYIQFANSGVSEQENQILTMVSKGARVIIIGAIDGSQLGSEVREAKKSGAYIIAYDRLIKNTKDVDYYVSFDNFKVGELQGKGLIEGLKKHKGQPPWNIELIAGSPDDSNSQVFFDGAMSVLKPLIENGTLRVKSKQVAFTQVATQGWKAENAQKRMDTILAGVYRDEPLHGILSPNDTLARAALTAVRSAGKEIPVTTGQDSEVESIKSILRGEQYCTVKKDTSALVKRAITMVNELKQGKNPTVNNTKSYNNGVKIVPAYLIEPEIVTLENIHEAYKDDPVLKDIIKK